MTVLLAKVVETCWGCPSQWDSWTIDGEYLYMRFRWGVGTVAREDGEEVARFETGDPLEGVMSLADFMARAGLQLAEVADVS